MLTVDGNINHTIVFGPIFAIQLDQIGSGPYAHHCGVVFEFFL